MSDNSRRENGMIAHLLLIILVFVWSVIISSIVGDDEFHEHYNTPSSILFGVVCTTASIHGIYLLITSKE
jgi:hypothetical protein